METLSQATTRLSLAGYVEDYRSQDGRLVSSQNGTSHDPAALTIDAIVRFEGDSNPDDAAILYALDAGCGHRGLYVAAYGSGATADDIAVVDALPDRTR